MTKKETTKGALAVSLTGIIVRISLRLKSLNTL